MLFLAGMHGKVKDCGQAADGVCPVCGRTGSLRVTHKYMILHLFFIPIFRFHSDYFVTCASCASLMELNKEKGKAFARGESAEIPPEDLRVVQNNAAALCSRCGARLPPDSAFCNRCGTRV